MHAVEATQASERALIERAKCGDHAAFEALYRAHSGWVYALCLRMCAAADVAEEATQLAFVRVWERLKTYRGDSGFRPWLRRLVVNVVLSGVRQTSRRTARVFSVEDTDQFGGAAPDRVDERIDLERAIAALPKGARTVLVLHDIEGLRHDEIAELTGIATGTSKAQLHRARQLIRKRLTQ
jgi:RNA polymerase sigma factor (sigma-70 family)